MLCFKHILLYGTYISNMAGQKSSIHTSNFWNTANSAWDRTWEKKRELWEKILLITNELIMQVAKLHVHTRSPFTNPVTYYLYKVSLGLLETHLFKDKCSTVCSELLSEFMKNIHFWTKPKIRLKYWTMQQCIKNNILVLHNISHTCKYPTGPHPVYTMLH